ncbi:antitoxin ParD1/3/4 [Neorhizobium galegae]|uniref:type II toxin-antitoxin system ParD family antitoxin n=1 Tax=Neorhizobium galegae TaxID=399 RepID=UPI001AE58B9F|nr:type II toxin-antitoxin system ParD family antitoxin [Neorhizobium galegae]MBP2550346.1 antitoxin ParD1/3/4 [Neorhizobium galegae]
MGRVATITVDEELAQFIDHKVSAGDYASESDVVAAALELREQEEEGFAAIRAAIDEGEASGEPQPFDPERFLKRMHGKYGA